MPTVLDNAKEAAYTAVGLNVLFLDEVSERFAAPRAQLDEQFDIARKHAEKARSDWQKQAEEFNASVKERIPFDVDAIADRVKKVVPFETDEIQERLQANVRRTWERSEPTMKWVAERTPAPFGSYVADGIAKMRDLLVEEAPAAKPETAVKTAAATATAKKAPARKAPARKATARKAPARKAAGA